MLYVQYNSYFSLVHKSLVCLMHTLHTNIQNVYKIITPCRLSLDVTVNLRMAWYSQAWAARPALRDLYGVPLSFFAEAWGTLGGLRSHLSCFILCVSFAFMQIQTQDTVYPGCESAADDVAVSSKALTATSTPSEEINSLNHLSFVPFRFETKCASTSNCCSSYFKTSLDSVMI